MPEASVPVVGPSEAESVSVTAVPPVNSAPPATCTAGETGAARSTTMEVSTAPPSTPPKLRKTTETMREDSSGVLPRATVAPAA